MSERTDRVYLSDIQEAARRIALYVAGMTYEAFLEDFRTQDAIIRNLEIVGEATKNLSSELRAAHVQVPWRNMAGVRDRLIHEYFGVNLEIIWHIATVELPAVALQIAEIVKEE